MVLVRSFYLLGAVNLVQGVAAQDFTESQPLSRLANGFIVEYADDPQTHSVVSSPFLVSSLRSGGGETAFTKSFGECLPSEARMCHAIVWSLGIPGGMYKRQRSANFDGKGLTFDRMSCKKLLLKYQMSRACKFRTRWTLGAPSSMGLLSRSPKSLKVAQLKA